MQVHDAYARAWRTPSMWLAVTSIGGTLVQVSARASDADRKLRTLRQSEETDIHNNVDTDDEELELEVEQATDAGEATETQPSDGKNVDVDADADGATTSPSSSTAKLSESEPSTEVDADTDPVSTQASTITAPVITTVSVPNKHPHEEMRTITPSPNGKNVNKNALRANANSSGRHSMIPPWWSPIVLVVLAVAAIGFLSYWSRRRRARRENDGNNDGDSANSGAMETTTSKTPGSSKGILGDASAVKSRVQYSRIEDQTSVEFDEDAAEYGDPDQWDDWEGDAVAADVDNRHLQQQSISSVKADVHVDVDADAGDASEDADADERETVGLARGYGSSSVVGPEVPSTQAPTSSPPPSADLGALLIAETVPTAGSNSSSDSYELVRPQDDVPASSTPDVALDAEAASVDDLFSQFGMVPTFKKSAPAPMAIGSFLPAENFENLSSNFESSSNVTNTAPTAEAVAASALFSAHLDELASVTAAATEGDEWGAEDDDDWVQGL